MTRRNLFRTLLGALVAPWLLKADALLAMFKPKPKVLYRYVMFGSYAAMRRSTDGGKTWERIAERSGRIPPIGSPYPPARKATA